MDDDRPTCIGGSVPAETLEELSALRTLAKDHAENFTEAVKVQAKKYGLCKGALRRYVTAKADGKLTDLDAEAEDLAKLLLGNLEIDGGVE